MANSTVIFYIAGLDTPIKSNLCGARSFLEKLSEELEADLIIATWNGEGMDYPLHDAGKKLVPYEHRFVAGHSHGADAAYHLASSMTNGFFDCAAFIDICPPWNPIEWIFGERKLPMSCASGIDFYQRNNALLAGVKMAESSICEVVNMTPYGVGHVEMVSHPYLQSMIAQAFRRAKNGV